MSENEKEGENQTDKSAEELAEELKKKDRDVTITVKHEGLGRDKSEGESGRTKEELEAIVSTMAYKEFEKQRDEFLSGIKDETKREEMKEKIQEPEDLERAKLVRDLIVAGVTQHGGHVEGYENEEFTEKLPPSTPAKAVASSGKRGSPEDVEQYINELYDVASDPTKTQKEREYAEQMINQLWREIKKGLIKSGKKTIEMLPTMQCPKCGTVITSPHGVIPECGSCGWKGSKHGEW